MDNSEIYLDFIAESADGLEQAEHALVELQEGRIQSMETVNLIFRSFHSMKGNAGFLELHAFVHLTHAAETLLDLYRKAESCPLPQHIGVLLRACDALKHMLDVLREHPQADSHREEHPLAAMLQRCSTDLQSGKLDLSGSKIATDGVDILSSIQPLLNLEAAEAEMFFKAIEPSVAGLNLIMERICTHPHDLSASNAALADLRAFRTLSAAARARQLELVSQSIELLIIAARETAAPHCSALAESASDLFARLRSLVIVAKRGSCQVEMLSSSPGDSFSGRLLSGSLSNTGLLQAVRKPAAEAALPLPVVVASSAFIQAPVEKVEVEAPPAEAEANLEASVLKAASSDKGAEQRRDIRVDLRKLDSLVDLVGELLVAEAMVTRNSELEGLQLPTFEKASHQLHLIIRGLQDVAMSVRMVPIAGVFRKMQRLVHDLARNTGKQIKLELSGEETEVDKIVADLIGDPMVHMLRNSADHGLETSEERVKAGKNPSGNIWLSASQQGNEIVISVRDDGKGLDRERIFDKAKRQGLISGDGSNLSEQEIYGMIFMPGFSTAAAVTGLSGRGVGMDVVKSNIERLKGRIEIKNNPGLGLEFLIRIPLSLAILDGMLLRVGPCKYMLPITAIREALRPSQSQIIIRHDGQEFIKLREQVMPIRRLHALHAITPEFEYLEKGILVILQLYSGPIAVFVDEILYQLQTVVKPVPSGITVNQGVTGFCILNNGEVALILDLGAFTQPST